MARHGNSEFKPEYEKLVIEMFSKGATMADFCAKIHNHRETVYNWMRVYPSFNKAYYIARELAKSYRDNFSIENMWVSYGEEGTNFDVKSYLRMTQPRFKDMERETPPPEIIPESKNGESIDLIASIRNLTRATVNETLTVEQSRAIATILSGALGVKEKEEMAKKLEEIEGIITGGAALNSGPVVSPTAECHPEEPEKPPKKKKTPVKKKAAPAKKKKATAKE